MTITAEIKQSFRDAYNMIEKFEIPTGDSKDQGIAFGDIACYMTQAVGETTGNKSLTAHLLIGVYDYFAEEVRKRLI